MLASLVITSTFQKSAVTLALRLFHALFLRPFRTLFLGLVHVLFHGACAHGAADGYVAALSPQH